jgi:predicted phosphodiesterase
MRRGSGEWSQDIVLCELIRDVSARLSEFPSPQFLVASGDLAFSGQPEEFVLAEAFLDRVRGTLGLARDRVFCVPGNHDIDRRIQTMCHFGAMGKLQSPRDVDDFLAVELERTTLFQRGAGYRGFERAFSATMPRTFTSDGLGYVAPLEVMDIPICIVGLDSAWLCQGGDLDERKLLVGERQMIDAMSILERHRPRLVVGIVHHPVDWLRRFDQVAFENRVIPRCDILHRGHLHESEIRITSQLSGHQCAIVAAGAAYASRDYKNSYTVCCVDIERSCFEVRNFDYDPSSGEFCASEVRSLELRLRGTLRESLGELAHAIERVTPSVGSIAHYLGALITGKKKEVPIVFGSKVAFASPEILESNHEYEGKELAKRFLSLRTIILAYSDDKSIEDRLRAHTVRIESYGKWMLDLSRSNPSMGAEISRCEEESRALAGVAMPSRHANTRSLLRRLYDDRDWPVLEFHAARLAKTGDTSTAEEATRMLILAMANSSEDVKQEMAIDMCRQLVSVLTATASEFLIAITVNTLLQRVPDAKRLIIEGLRRFPSESTQMLALGRDLAIETGDAVFRHELESITQRRPS